MTLVPTALLPDRITVEPYEGHGAYGPIYGPAQSGIPARVEGKRRAVRKQDGTDVISTAAVTVRRGVNVPTESRITAPHPETGLDDTFHVLEVITLAGYRRPAGYEVMVG